MSGTALEPSKSIGAFRRYVLNLETYRRGSVVCTFT